MINGGLRINAKIKTHKIDKPLITVVTVVYNAEETLEQTIQSVINQTYDNLEYIIIDGASTDGTLEIIKKYEDKIDYWQSEPDKGVYDAMNKGIHLAKGEYIYIIGADDWLVDENIILNIVPYLQNNYDVVCGRVWQIDKRGYQKIFDNYLQYEKNEDLVKCKISSPHQGMFVKTSIMRKYLFDVKYKIAADFKSLLTLWFDKDVLIQKIPDIVAFYSSEGMSGHNENARKKETFEILQEFGLEKTLWAKKLGLGVSKGRRIKNFLKKMGFNKILEIYRTIRDILNHRLMKHSCNWDFCRYCK